MNRRKSIESILDAAEVVARYFDDYLRESGRRCTSGEDEEGGQEMERTRGWRES